MEQLAAAAGKVYGTDPTSLLTWDYNKLAGCECDSAGYSFAAPHPGDVSDWKGWNCSQRTCPYGNPLSNKGKSPEIQRVVCTKNVSSSSPSGSGFYLTFGGETTGLISVDAKPGRQAVPDGESVEEKLEALTSIGDVEVWSAAGAAAAVCTAAGNAISIKFYSELGNIAEVTSGVTGSTVTAVVSTTTQGQTIKAECGGGGICDEASGLCKCFRNHVSSDKNNKRGLSGDCGFYDSNFSGVNYSVSGAPRYV
jgi:hypothetical protein